VLNEKDTARLNALREVVADAAAIRMEYLTQLKRRNIPVDEVKLILGTLLIYLSFRIDLTAINPDFSSKELESYASKGEVIIFSIVLASSKPLDVSDLSSIAEVTLKETKFAFQSEPQAAPIREKGPARAPKGSGPPKRVNVRVRNQAAKDRVLVDQPERKKVDDKCYYYYIDIVAKKDDIIDGQTSDYVRQALELVIGTGIFRRNGITKLSIWSDGCGKVLILFK
jgi:hypothetical protein